MPMNKDHKAMSFRSPLQFGEGPGVRLKDGSIHNLTEVKERDEGREEELKKFGLSVVRFTNDEIETDIENLLNKLKMKL